MRILNFGSLNIDYVYAVDAFLRPGETKAAANLMINCGGKGLNQSIAAAKAGNAVWHAGLLGDAAGMLRDKLVENGVDVRLLMPTAQPAGHAIIQVDESGQNCILLYGGTNRMLTKELVDNAFDAFTAEEKSGLVLLQNETNLVPYIIEQAAARGLSVALNAAPMDASVKDYPLDQLTWLIVNEVEGGALAGTEDEDAILPALHEKYPHCGVLLTLGAHGARCMEPNGRVTRCGSYRVRAVDTTAAGDTFTGYFLYGMLHGLSVPETLRLATTASALCVGRPGAADSVPEKAEVDAVRREERFGALLVSTEEA
ncbi:MAG: ribokinase [bacterium]|nr:ribokinase [bacterium]